MTQTVSILALASLALGWSAGFRSLPAYLIFWLFCGTVAAIAHRIVRSAFSDARGADAILRAGVIAFAAIVLTGFLCGATGLIGVFPYLGLLAIGAAATLAFPLARRSDSRSEGGWLTWPAVAVLLPLLVFIVAVAIVQSPYTLYDSISYHMLFAARWLQDRRLEIVATPFSDPAQAYQPGNGELFFLWLMLPFHGDVFARLGQIPFLLLGATALYAIARRLGASPSHALYAPVFYALARPVTEQAAGANVDLICAAMFLASFYLGLRAIDSNERRDWALWGVSVGLYCGTKYLALVYLPVLMLLPFVRGLRPRAAWALPGVFAFGFPWYLRNWLIAGSPIYPASLQIAGVTLAHGAYTHAAMNNSVFHVTALRLLPPLLGHGFGMPLFLVWIPTAALAIAAVIARGRFWPDGFVLLAPALMLPLYWFGLPDNGDSRFFLPAVVLATVVFALPFGRDARWNRALQICYGVGMAWVLIGRDADWPVRTLPWFMIGWVKLNGLIATPYLGYFALVAASLYASFRIDRRLRHAIATPAAAAVCVVLLAVGSKVECAPYYCHLLDLTPTDVKAEYVDAWNWVHEYVHAATFANVGNNVPYPLFGDRLANRVYYVNIDRHLDWGFHDYARVRSRSAAAPPADALASPSGELLPVSRDASRTGGASRPRFERVLGDRDAWLANLAALGVNGVFITKLTAYEIDCEWHNARGFPIEDEWAQNDPKEFRRVYENLLVRIYSFSPDPGVRTN